MSRTRDLTFGSFHFDQANERLWQGKHQVKLRAKPLAVLHYFLEHPGRLVMKEELQQHVWKGTYVSNTVLKVCLREIRMALKDEATKPQFIQTEHGQGYRFIAPVLPLSSQAAPRRASRVTSPPGSRKLTPIFVGREEELAYLRELLTTVLDGGRQVIFVTGEAGIGKTTVVDMFLKQWAADGSVWVGRGQCIEHYGAGEPYMPVLEALGRLCREPGGEPVLEELRRCAPTWVVQLPGLRGEAGFEALRHQGATKERMLREMAEALESLTARRGVVLCLEDLQWGDHATLELISYIARRQGEARLLVVGTYRPADSVVSGHRLRGLKQELQAHGNCQELELRYLTTQEVARYLSRRFPDNPFSTALARVIEQRTDGNPLFVVNAVDYLITQGVIFQINGQWELKKRVEEVDIGVPGNLQQLIEKQVEELGAEEQRVLEVASVAGKQFAGAAVTGGVQPDVGEAEEVCERLARKGQFLQERGVEKWPDGTVTGLYQFQHALYQNVLYGRVAEARRVRLHRFIGEREEAGYGERAREIAGELAVHFEHGRDRRRAVQYRTQAGENAFQRSAHIEAISHFTRGLELVKTFPDTPERTQQELTLQITLGVPLTATKGYGDPELRKAYTRARELCLQIGETPQLFPALRGLWRFHVTRAELQTARELGEQLLRLAERQQDAELFLDAHFALGQTLFHLGELTSALGHLEQGSALYEAQPPSARAFLHYVTDPGVICLSYAALALWVLGYPDQASKKSQESLSLAQHLSHPYSSAWALNFAATVQQFCGDRQAVRELAETMTALSLEQGFPFWLALGTVLSGWARVETDKKEEGIVQMRQGLVTYQTIGAEVARLYYLILLSEAYGQAEQAEAGLATLTEASTILHNTGERWCEAEMHRLKGQLLLAQESKRHRPVLSPSTTLRTGTVKGAKGKKTKKSSVQRLASRVADIRLPTPDTLSEAEACFQQALEIARCQQAKSLELRATMSLSRLWQQQGKKKEARQLLAEVYGWFTEGFETADLKEAKALLEELDGEADIDVSLPRIITDVNGEK